METARVGVPRVGAEVGANRLGVVILAAGAGTRMGGVAKALLRRGERTFLACIAAACDSIGVVDQVVVVGPPFGDAVAAHARELGIRVVVNGTPARGMASSVALGFAAISDSAAQAAWLWPVDHPDVRVETLRELVESLDDHEVVVPTYAGRGGHPPLVRRAVWSRLAACGELEGGARVVIGASDVRTIAVTDAGVVRDIDTPADEHARSAR